MTSPLRKAAWWAQDYAYAAAWQLRSAVDRTEPSAYAAGPKRPVVIVPGIYETWRFMQPLVRILHDDGHPVHVITLLQHNRLPVPDAARHLVRYLDEHALLHSTIVAHSKGGLIGKHAMIEFEDRGDGRNDGGDRRIDSMVAIGTPFSGSRYARYLFARSLRAFSASDSTMRFLAENDAVNSRITSVYGLFDPHIPEGSELPGGRNVQLDTGGHFRILADRRTIELVLEVAE